MDKKGIVVIGQGKISRSISKFPGVIGYVKIDEMKKVLSPDNSEYLFDVDPENHFGVIGIGKTIYKEIRSKEWKDLGYKLGVLIHPSSFVDERALIGEGSVIWPLCYIDDGSTIGECTTIGPQCAVRGAKIGNYCHLTIQNKILPESSLEDFVFLGAGATILEKVSIGKGSVVGANSTVLKNIPERMIYYEKKEGRTKNIVEGLYYPLTDLEKKIN